MSRIMDRTRRGAGRCRRRVLDTPAQSEKRVAKRSRPLAIAAGWPVAGTIVGESGEFTHSNSRRANQLRAHSAHVEPTLPRHGRARPTPSFAEQDVDGRHKAGHDVERLAQADRNRLWSGFRSGEIGIFLSARPRASGDPGRRAEKFQQATLDSRLRGNERIK